MNSNDKDHSKDWEDRLKDFHIKQDDLNKLIMDYLVNGKQKKFICQKMMLIELIFE